MTHIHLENVGVAFTIYGGRQASLRKVLINQTVGGLIRKDQHHRNQIIGLQNVSLEIVEGDRVAIIGSNGAGKTTLLRTITGICRPTSGRITIEGVVVSLLERNLGMDPDASGIENIRSRGRFLGLSRKRVDEQIDDIAEFTELGDFLYLPLRTYSAGMQIRLSFGIATALESDILIMDEWIGAGDQSFRDKAQARLGALVDRSSILLVATHSIPLSRRLCNKALWLDRGTVCAFGEFEETLAKMQAAQ